MNNKIKLIGIFAGGAVIGAVSAVFITKNKYKTMYERIVEEEIASIRATSEAKNVEYDCPDGVEEDERVLVVPGKYQKIAKRYSGVTNYNDIIKGSKELQEDYYKYEKTSKEANEQHDGIYVISIEQFNEEMDHYDKLTISYYADDDTLVDENEEIISDVIQYIGPTALESFGEGSDDPDIVYVRNEKMAIDYEVILLNKSYKETVLGHVEGRDEDEE